MNLQQKAEIKLDISTALQTKAGIAFLTFALGGGTGTLINRYADTPTREQYAAILKGQDEVMRLMQSFDARLNAIEQDQRDEKLKQDILDKQRRR